MAEQKTGCVYLVGAGSGDPDLITVRGRDLIAEADVIVYDYLASKQLLAWAKEGVELIYVGKKAGAHSVPQEQTNEILVDLARKYDKVVRLKGGDPYVFGRGGEEVEVLYDAGIAFEVVPGVTAAVAASAYAGIPVTHRDYASEFALITGHEDAKRTEGTQIDWEILGKWRGTLAFYMGVRNLPMICERLIENGMDPDTPVALIQQGTTTEQKTAVGTLTTIVDEVKMKGIVPPAMIVVGHVVKLRERLSWFEKRPLFGQNVVVTRSRAQASEISTRLRLLGANVVECPMIKIVPPVDSTPLNDAIGRLGEYDWVVFTSVNGVKSFFEHLNGAGLDARALASNKVCVIGPATAACLEEHGIMADLMPKRFVAESIVEALEEAGDLNGQKLLLARADIARSDLARILKEKNATIDEVDAYCTVEDSGATDEIVEKLNKNELDWITFASSSTVKNFFNQVDKALLAGKKVRLASIGPITSETIREFGLTVDVEAEEYTFDGLIKAIKEANK